MTGRCRARRVGASGAGPWPNAVRPYMPPPRTTALGSLVHYITHADSGNYQPANISFDLLPPMEGLPRAIARDRRARREKQCERALEDFGSWLERRSVGPLSVVRGPLSVATDGTL